MQAWWLVVAFVMGCGRIGFDPFGPPAGVQTASAPLNAAGAWVMQSLSLDAP